MSEIDNLCPLENIIHRAFHDMADKFDVDVDLVAQIIAEYNDIMSKNIQTKPIIDMN